ncbi:MULTISPECIES: hypothetical protein [unclassified Afifella]|uniref:hypothetical protein n=1 Tax=unclassified Afifella TaxID=2624128 RepID=UPI001F3DB172|nr:MULTISPECIES: hypothetical protein [unclassified Afifella]MCF1502376.1 hypothetical protein [Afifella sp. H1R]MCT8266333.1 hypothetical protein [Afifella sp. JA880]
MDVVDLVLAVCLVNSPNSCHEEHLYYQSSGPLKACLWEAMPTMAQWAGEHPKWRIAGFHCAWVNDREEKI